MRNDSCRRNTGFTLIELIVVIAILAILAAVAVPNYFMLTQNARTATEVAAAVEFVNAINIYNSLNPAAIIAGSGTGTPPTAEDIDKLEAAELLPVTVFTDEELNDRVLSRILTDANGYSMISIRGDIT